MKYCRTCKTYLPPTDFDGRRQVCNACLEKKAEAKRQKQKELAKQERQREHKRRANEAHRAKIDRQQHREYMKRHRRFARWCSRRDDIPRMRYYEQTSIVPISYDKVNRGWPKIFDEFFAREKIELEQPTGRPTEKECQKWVWGHDQGFPGRRQVGDARVFMGEQSFTYKRIVMGRMNEKTSMWIPLDHDFHHDHWSDFRHWEGEMERIGSAMRVVNTWRRDAERIRNMPIPVGLRHVHKTQSWANACLCGVRQDVERLSKQMDRARSELYWQRAYPEAQRQLEEGIKSLRNYCVKWHIDKYHAMIMAQEIENDADDWLDTVGMMLAVNQ